MYLSLITSAIWCVCDLDGFGFGVKQLITLGNSRVFSLSDLYIQTVGFLYFVAISLVDCAIFGGKLKTNKLFLMDCQRN